MLSIMIKNNRNEKNDCGIKCLGWSACENVMKCGSQSLLSAKLGDLVIGSIKLNWQLEFPRVFSRRGGGGGGGGG